MGREAVAHSCWLQVHEMFLLLLTLLPLCVVSEKRFLLNFHLQPFKPLNRTYLPIFGTVFSMDDSFTVIGQISSNGTYKGRLSWPWELGDDVDPRFVNSILLEIQNDDFVQKAVFMTMNITGSTQMKIVTQDYKMHIWTKFQNFSKVSTKALGFAKDIPNSCGCKLKNCACCETINMPRMKFTHEICANISYNPATIGIDLAVGVDGHYYIHEISARNPPPVCFDVPYAKEIASICLAFTGLDLNKKHLSGCIEVDMELVHMRVAHVPLGCFNMPI